MWTQSFDASLVRFSGGKLYALSAGVADITTGTNGACGTSCTAAVGYDFVTGLGSPRRGVDTALKSAS